jgi:hypothetical protein
MVLASVLLVTPLVIVFARMTQGSTPGSGVPSPQIVFMLRGLAGLELFLAAQLCLLICWVRSASAVDFRGGYRTWRWMSILLLFTSLLLVTGTWLTLTDLIAGWLTPVIGLIDAARPTLLLVPFGGTTAFVLRSLIPDMGRCRPAQLLAIAAVVVAVWRTVSGLRGNLTPAEEELATLELLTSGLVLSASDLYCRYVIHVNPNPPVVVSMKADSTSEAASTSLIPIAALPTPDPTPESAAVERVETAFSPPPAESGNKASRKKQRKAA